MNLADRRGAILTMAGLAPVLATRPVLAASTAGTPILPPPGPMLYRRVIERALPDGLLLTVERSFAVHFEELGRGFRLAGSQTSAQVHAPENLAGFARLEEQRVETGVFPLLLDGTGLIVSGPSVTRSAEVDEALELAESLLVLEAGAPGDEGEVAQLLDSLHRSTTQAVSYLPPDLFAPRLDRRVDERAIDLPWGDSGQVRVEFEARRDPATGLMRQASRRVTTNLLGEQLQSVESWELR